MSSRKWVSYVGRITPILLLLVSCAEPESKAPDNWTGVCVDSDGDGFGFQCAAGADCDDSDASIHVGCGRCDKPSEGCECAADSLPVACSLPLELTETGALLCREGTRYCRDGLWTECEGIRSYEAPPPSDVPGVQLLGLGPADGGTGRCNACRPDCYEVGDPTQNGLDAGSATNVAVGEGGGITLIATPQEAGMTYDAGFLDDYECTVGVPPDKDCDGIPDTYDEYEGEPPFKTNHTTIFMDLAPGQSREQNLAVDFNLAAADIYFYLDMTGSMEEERDGLIASLTSGNFLPNGGVGMSCADRDFDDDPDDYLKTQGVAGNIACLIRDARFGAGWFRDLPFSGFGPSGAAHGYPMYEHRLDMTDDVSLLTSALNRFETQGGADAEEGSMQGLYAIATGGEIYPGWDRPGVPARTDCPPNRWGYPCFRRGAVPIIIHVTDQGLHSGPGTYVGGTDYKYPYSSSDFSNQRRGTPGTFGASTRYYHPLTSAAEHFGNAQDIGVVDGKFITYAANTETMTSDLTYTTTGTCGSGTAWDANQQSGKDAVFKFTVGTYTNGSTTSGTARRIKLSARGSRFDTTLMLRAGAAPVFMPIAASNNGTFSSAYNIGTLAAGQRLVVGGDSSGHESVYPREGLTSPSACFVGTSASDVAPASVLKFQLASDMSVRVSTDAAGGANSSLLMGSAIAPTRTQNLAEMDCGAGTRSNCHDQLGDFSVGDVSGGYVHLTGGNTAASGLTSNYVNEFATCSNANYESSRDSVVEFKLTKSTPIRIETTGAGSNMSASFPHGISLIRKANAATTVTKPVPAGNGEQATAATILESDIPANGSFVRFAGNSSSDTATYSQLEVGGAAPNACGNGNAGAPSAAKDVVFKFTVSTTQAYEFDTTPEASGSGYKTWLSLHRGQVGRVASQAISNTSVLDTAQGQSVATGAQGPIDNRRVVLTNGQIEQRDRSYTPSTMGANCGSTGNGSAYGGRDVVFKFRATTASQVNIRTVGPDGTGLPAFDSYFAVFRGSIAGGNRVSGDCPSPSFWNPNANNQSGNGWVKTINTEANTDYYVVVKEWLFNTSPTAAGSRFGVVIEDTRYASTFVACDAGSSSTDNNFSRITSTLTPGTYYLVLKGTGTSPNTNYALNVRRISNASSAGTVVACANSTSDRAAIEQTLPAGDYAVIIKGQRVRTCVWGIFCSDTDHNGTYDLTIRDLSVAPKPVACQNTADGGNFVATSLKKNDSNGRPIDYYLVTRGNATGGSYQVVIEDVAAPAITGTTVCDNNSGGLNNAEMERELPPGTYYAILKGRSGADQGWSQLSIGEDRTTVTSTGTFAPKTWQGANQVRAALLENEIRVIPVNAVHGSGGGLPAFTYTTDGYKQTLVLGKETGGLASSASRAYEIGTNGSGMGTSVIQAVSDIANNLSMDLGLHLDGNPGFRLRVQALPGSGNCSPPIDTTADGVADTHVDCRPGATPKYKITFTNPSVPQHVPPNPDDPQGGYHMRLQLIGDRKYVVDEIPVYLIPHAVVPPSNPDLYATSGTYEHAVAAECTGTDAPMWRSLSWRASVPAGTSIVWKACTAATSAELAGCSLQTAATVTSGGPCVNASQCPNGYCGSGGRCEYVVGPSCSADDDCGEGGVCVANTCRWTQNPIDLLPALRNGHQGKSHMRVNVTLNSSEDRLAAPSIAAWNLNYFCTAQL